MGDDELDGIFSNAKGNQIQATAEASSQSHVHFLAVRVGSSPSAVVAESFNTDTTSVATVNLTNFTYELWNISKNSHIDEHSRHGTQDVNNYWALLALVLVVGTAAGNILVCLAIAWERRLQNVTNYFLMSLAITDLMVAILVMPLGILTLVKGYFPLESEHCLTWICLDVLFCTASIMHLCTISVDRYLSLRYPMRFGRNKTRRRVTLKIVFVWLLSIAMSLPLSLMYSKDHASVLVNGTCQIPDPVYKLVGSIVCFYIPLGVMLLTYCLTVRLLARQRQNLGGSNHPTTTGWASGWLGQTPALERRCTWRRLLKTTNAAVSNHAHSATSTDTELSTLDTHELWLPDSSIQEPTPSTMTALHLFGAEMLKLSKGLESATDVSLNTMEFENQLTAKCQMQLKHKTELEQSFQRNIESSPSPTSLSMQLMALKKRRRASISTSLATYENESDTPKVINRKRLYSLPNNALRYLTLQAIPDTLDSQTFEPAKKCFDIKNHRMEIDGVKEFFELPPPCTCPYFGDKPMHKKFKPAEVKIISANNVQLQPLLQKPTDLVVTVDDFGKCDKSQTVITTTAVSNKISQLSPEHSNDGYLPLPTEPSILQPSQQHPLPIITTRRKLSYSKTASVVTWDSTRHRRRGSSFGGVRTTLLLTPTKAPVPSSPLRRSATLRNHNNIQYPKNENSTSIRSSKGTKCGLPCLMQRNQTVRSHHSRNSSVISRNSSRHGRIIRLEQKATKVLGVVFFTFVILWAPFFVLNLLPTVCGRCEDNISYWVFDVVTWLGYASSMVNPIFYTIFNKVFRQAFKKVLLCQYGGNTSEWRPNR